MPEVYTLRAPENFNHSNGHRLPSGNTRGNQNYDHERIPSSPSGANNFLQPPSSSLTHRNSNSRAPTAAATKKRKVPVFQRIFQRKEPQTSHVDSQDRTTPVYNRRSPSPRSNGLLHSPRNQVTTYTLTSPEDNLVSSHTPPSPVSLIFEKVKFNR